MKNFKILISLLIFLFTFSCSVNEKPHFAYRSENQKKGVDQNFYIKRFRDNTFYKCLKYGYGDSLNFEIGKLMAKKDLFSPSDEPFTKEEESIQDSLAKKIIKNLPKPYILVEDENSIKDKNFIISTCLSYYESKELNTIAKKFYDEKIKDNKKLWGKDYK
jgi:hypothetical protein